MTTILNATNEFLIHSLSNEERIDGRKLMDFRKIGIIFNRRNNESHAELQLGKTRVLSVIKGSIISPNKNHPNEGMITFQVEMSPMSSLQAIEEMGKKTSEKDELSRIIERGIRDANALDKEALVIIPGEKVWSIDCRIHILDYGGNLIDASSISLIAALMHFRFPEITVSNGKIISHNDRPEIGLNLHHIPVTITFGFFQIKNDKTDVPIIIIDPTEREEMVMEGSVSYTFNFFHELCAVHKIGGIAVSSDIIIRCATIASSKAAELTDLLKKQADIADKKASLEKTTEIRGSNFNDLSIDDLKKEIKSN